MNKPAVLITGGTGYIGSHTAYLMAQKGYKVIIIDWKKEENNFDHEWATVYKSDFANEAVLHEIFSTYNIEAVMHFAAFIEVGESVKNPSKYYENNVVKTIKLLNVMLEHNVKNFIYSSSCAVYGVPEWLPLTEDHSRNPISPYGKTKYMVEMVLEDLNRSHGLQFASLRYFNACGAMPENNLGERHNPETHIIPLLLRAVEQERTFYIFGNDYPTQDGTCIRDYLHVNDLATAHWAAVEYLMNGGASDYFNLGTGTGISVKEMIEEVEKVCDKKVNVVVADRRPGDPPILVAEPKKANTKLHWKPQHSSLENILKTAYTFYLQHNVKSAVRKSSKNFKSTT